MHILLHCPTSTERGIEIKDPLAALEAIGQANALLTYEIGMLVNGDRLDKLEPRLNELQKRLSRITAMLISDPDTVVTFGTMSDEDRQKFDRQDAEIEQIVTLPSAQVIVEVVAEPKDDRIIARQVADAVRGIYAGVSHTDGVTVDLSVHIDALLALIDPYGEGYPDERQLEEEKEWANHDEEFEQDETEEVID